jgi:hypothetical protein
MIPDYVLQVQETQRNLETQSLVTRENWQDSVAQRFYDNYVNKYDEKIYLYINGGMNITGMGLDELLRFFDKKQNEMEQLSGMNMSIDAGSGERIHNDYRERVDWYEPYKGPQPGNLDAPEVKGIMNERERK